MKKVNQQSFKGGIFGISLKDCFNFLKFTSFFLKSPLHNRMRVLLLMGLRLSEQHHRFCMLYRRISMGSPAPIENLTSGLSSVNVALGTPVENTIRQHMGNTFDRLHVFLQ